MGNGEWWIKIVTIYLEVFFVLEVVRYFLMLLQACIEAKNIYAVDTDKTDKKGFAYETTKDSPACIDTLVEFLFKGIFFALFCCLEKYFFDTAIFISFL